MLEPQRKNAGMLLGATLVLLGVVIGAGLFGRSTPPAQAANGTSVSLALPAITLSADQVALVADAAGRYMIIDPRGNAGPVRIKDIELRNIPSESFVRVP